MSKRGGGEIDYCEHTHTHNPTNTHTHTGDNAESNYESVELETEHGEQGCTHLSNIISLICDEDSDVCGLNVCRFTREKHPW